MVGVAGAMHGAPDGRCIDRLFLLSPASMGGRRGQLLLRSQNIDMARRLQAGEAVPLGDVFAFISALYFRGKLAYARTFGAGQTFVITSSRGLLPPDTPVTLDMLREFGDVPIDADEPRFVAPLVRDLRRVCGEPAREVVLLGSVATSKYTRPLLEHLGTRLLFPSTFVGRGDMSRGGLLLRAAQAGIELEYAPVALSVLKGTRPPRL